MGCGIPWPWNLLTSLGLPIEFSDLAHRGYGRVVKVCICTWSPGPSGRLVSYVPIPYWPAIQEGYYSIRKLPGLSLTVTRCLRLCSQHSWNFHCPRHPIKLMLGTDFIPRTIPVLAMWWQREEVDSASLKRRYYEDLTSSRNSSEGPALAQPPSAGRAG